MLNPEGKKQTNQKADKKSPMEGSTGSAVKEGSKVKHRGKKNKKPHGGTERDVRGPHKKCCRRKSRTDHVQ